MKAKNQMNELMLIDPEWFQNNYEPALSRMDQIGIEKIEAAVGSSLSRGAEQILDISKDSASITIEGILTRNGPSLFQRILGFDGASYGEIASALSVADQTLDAGKPIYLQMNTPGGEVSGAKETFDAIRAVSQRRPVIAMNNGMIASAGMWLASAATEILASGPTAMAGSIGVMKRIPVEKGTVVITNTDSPDKAPDVSTDEGRAVLRSMMDDLYSVFVNDVIAGRGSRTSAEAIKGTRGRLMAADRAIAVGLMDGYKKKSELDTSGNLDTIATVTSENAGDESPEKTETENMDEKTKAEIVAEVIAGVKAGMERDEKASKAAAEQISLISAVTPYLASEQYPVEIRKLGISCLNGETSLETFRSAVAEFDAKEEARKSSEAATESEKIGATASAPESGVPSSGIIETESQFRALMAQFNN